MRTKKCIVAWLLIMVLVLMQLPLQAATLVEFEERDISGTRDLLGLEVGQYCYAEAGEAVCIPYSGYLNNNTSYHTTSGGIAVCETIQKMQGQADRDHNRYYIIKRPTDLHMAPSDAMRWCVERVDPISHELYVGPLYGETEGHMITESVPSFKLYPSINYYGVNYDLDGGSWQESTDWIETVDDKENGIWKATEEQYDEDGNLYEDNIWFAYENFEVGLSEIDDAAKEGYELRGWETRESEIAPGGTYSVSVTDAVYRTEWQMEKIDIRALWEPKTIGDQEVGDITLEGATFAADYEAYYDLTDMGFMYKKSSDEDWIEVEAVQQNGKLIAAVTGLDSGTLYDVKGYLVNRTGRIENEVASFRTIRPQSVGNAVVGNLTQYSADFSVDYICDYSLLTTSFKYKNATDSEWTEVQAEPDSTSETLTASVSNLERNTQYQVKAFLKTAHEESESQETTSFTTPKIEASVGTVEVSSVTKQGASFIADYVSDDELLEQGFQYKKSADAEWTGLAATVSGNALTADAANLASNTSYTVKAYIKTAEGVLSGAETSFTTLRGSSGGSDRSKTETAPSNPAGSEEGELKNVSIQNNTGLEIKTTAIDNKTLDGIRAQLTKEGKLTPVGGSELNVSLSTGTKDKDDNKITAFKEPIDLSIDLSGVEVNDTSKLTIVRYEKQADGSVKAVKLGGTYDEKTKTFSTKVDKPGDYGIAEAEDLQQVNLAVGNKVIIVNGKEVANDIAPEIIGGSTMLPLRFIAESLGAEVKWNSILKQVEINLDGQTLIVGKENGMVIKEKEGRAMMPIRFISESFGANVLWIPSTKEVRIVR